MGRNSQSKNDGANDKKSFFTEKFSSFADVYMDLTNMQCKELGRLAKGEDSDYIGFNGKSKLQRVFGIVSAPVLLPMVYISVVPLAWSIGQELQVKKPKTPNRDIM